MDTNNPLHKETERIKILMSEQMFLGGPAMGLTSPKNVAKTIDWAKTWNRHDWLTFVEITTGILGIIPTPATPVLLFISAAAGVSNATGYWKEGHHYEAGLMLAFSLLGTGALFKILKNSKIFMKLGAKKSTELIEKVASGTASRTEQEMAKQLVEEIAPVADELAKETLKEAVRKFISQLPKQSLIFIIKILRSMVKLGVFGIKTGIVIEGTFYTYDKIYTALNYKNEKFMSERERSESFKLLNILKEKEPEVKKTAIEIVKGAEGQILQNSELFANIDTSINSVSRNRKIKIK